MADQPTPTAPRATGTFRVKRGLAEMLKGGVIMDVVTPEQAKIAEDKLAFGSTRVARWFGRQWPSAAPSEA